MQITKKDISGMAKALLDFINGGHISDVRHLYPRFGRVPVRGVPDKEFIEIDSRSSEQGTSAFTISYCSLGNGIPIELRINPSLHYLRVIVKSGELFDGYNGFLIDTAGNTIQERTVPLTNFSVVQSALENLIEKGQ